MSSSLDREEERLRAAIRRDTEGLRQAVDELQTAAQQRMSARHAISNHPMAWLTGAVVVGWIIGSRVK
jgi:hypothetical protein